MISTCLCILTPDRVSRLESNFFQVMVQCRISRQNTRFTKDDMSTKAVRSMLISNRILTKDGKLNMAKVRELGWTVAEVSTPVHQAAIDELLP